MMRCGLLDAEPKWQVADYYEGFVNRDNDCRFDANNAAEG